MLKWKLMVSTLPVVLALLGLKLFLEHVLGFEGLIDFSDVGIILTSGVFLIGFLLAGTMADYKEAEIMPHMKGREILIEADVGVGRGKAKVWTCDLTDGYVKINGAYRS